jgi:hypothetical protein
VKEYKQSKLKNSHKDRNEEPQRKGERGKSRCTLKESKEEHGKKVA